MRRTRGFVMAVAAAGLGITVLVASLPSLAFAYRNPELHIALQTAESLIGFLVAYLVLGRLRRRPRLPELLLCLGLAVLAFSNLTLSLIPAVLGDEDAAVSTWSALLARLAGAILFAGAALAPDRHVRLDARRAWRLGLSALAAFAVLAGLVAFFEDSLPRGVTTLPGEPNRPHLEGHWVVLAAQLVAFVLYAVAAVGFLRRHERSGDTLLAWLAVGAVLSAIARLNYFLYPSLFSDYVYSGDLFRLAFYLVILVAAFNEIRSYWRDVALTAALEERRRIARDLHDGLAQELASILRNLRWLEPNDEFVKRASASAERALAQSRRAILALAEGAGVTIHDALAETVRLVGDREGTRVVLNGDSDLRLAPADREALVLIAAEAITNAARHSESDLVRVELSGERPLRLRIRDYGVGFDVSEVRSGYESGMGLRVMHERAEGIGATLHVESRPGAGTSIEVVL